MNFIGIDLGTTFSVVAFINEDGAPQTIPNANGRFTTPSVVYFGEATPIVGEEAKDQQALGAPEIGAFFKRYMGDSYYELMFNDRAYNPIDLSALVLAHLKEMAKEHLGKPVTHAVITVPAYFNNIQREATIEAGKLAGLEVLSIISEPTSAALAYGLRPSQGEETVLVYDLGGGTFDVSVVRISSTQQQVFGTGGDHTLGGKDWDDRIFTYLLQAFEDQFGVELDGDDLNDMLVKAENCKRSLSTRSVAKVTVNGAGHRGSYELSRDLFEEMTQDLLLRTKRLTEQVLEEINLDWNQLTSVLLVGGSTRMPMVRDYVQQMSGKPPLTAVNPDEAVALGAAIQAAMDIEQVSQNTTPQFRLAGRKTSIDAISHSMGMIAINEDGSKYINSVIIQKNQPIPTEDTRPYTLRLGRDHDRQLDVYMTQGETTDPADCAYLGKYVFSDIPSISGRTAVLDITYAYDKNGIVNVSAAERSTSHPLKLTIEPLPEDIPGRFLRPPEQEKVREHLTVYLAFDVSGSMSGQPLAEAKKAAHAFVRQCDLSNTSIGLISFSDKVYMDAAAGQNVRQITKAIDGLSIGRTGYGNATQPFDQIYSQMNQLSGLRYALVLADGVWSNQAHAIKQAKKCHAAEIEIIGIGFGGADKKFLKAISSSDEMSFFTSMNDLTTTFSSIAQELTESAGQPPTGRSGFSLFKR